MYLKETSISFKIERWHGLKKMSNFWWLHFWAKVYGILFPQTWDSTTGIAILKGEVIAKPQPLYGFMTLIPVLLAFTITTIHWYQTEESSKRLKTLPLLLAQIWPQYRVGRILWLYKKGNQKWIKEKELLERKLSSLGEFAFDFKYRKVVSSNTSCLEAHRDSNEWVAKIQAFSWFSCK